MPLFPLPALLPLAVTLAFLVASAVQEPRSAIAAGVYLLLAVPFYHAARKLRRQGP